MKRIIVFTILTLLSIPSLFASDFSNNKNIHDPRWRFHHRAFCAPTPVVFFRGPRYFVPPVPIVPMGYVNVVVPPRPIPTSLTDQIRNGKRMIDNQSYDGDKMRVARNVANDLPLTSLDVLDILNMFTYENAKLDYAKFAYHKVTDQKNFVIVYQTFKYNTSIKDLEDYIYSGR